MRISGIQGGSGLQASREFIDQCYREGRRLFETTRSSIILAMRWLPFSEFVVCIFYLFIYEVGHSVSVRLVWKCRYAAIGMSCWRLPSRFVSFQLFLGHSVLGHWVPDHGVQIIQYSVICLWLL